jgi:multiple sugar transport system ATP-binding protein
VALDGQVVNALEPREREVAMVFQNHALYPHLTVHDNLALGLKLRKVPKAELEPRVREAAGTLGLTPLLDRLPRELSGGERQRVALGRALVRRPRVYLFDEPLSNLDAGLRVQLRRQILQLHRRLPATTIHVTHDQAEAMTLGERVAVLNEGCLEQVADPLTLYARPATLFVAGFIGSPPMNLIRGRLHAGAGPGELEFEPESADGPGQVAPPRLRVAPAHASMLAGRLGEPLVLGLRPEHLFLDTGGSGPGAMFPATVELVEPLGAESHLHLRIPGASLVARVPPACRPQPGMALPLRCDMSEAHYFDPLTGRTCLTA